MIAIDRPVTLLHPPVIEFGTGTASKVGEWAAERGAARVLVVADAFNADRTGALGFTATTTVLVFADVKPEPDTVNLDDLLARAKAFCPDLVVGFGGGSAMDLAKLAAVLGDGDQQLSDVVGTHLVEGRRPLLVQVSTTSGTGSEAGTRALVTDTANARKLAVESRFMLADLAVLDPELTVSLPPAVTAATGVDALAHCVESYTNIKAHPAVDPYAIEGIRLIGRFLPRAVANGRDLEARAALALASLYGGFCLGPVNTAAGHAVAYPLGTRHGLPHGLANALIFPYVLAFNVPACPEKTTRILELLGHPAKRSVSPVEVFDLAQAFCREVGIQPAANLPSLDDDELEAMADEAFAIKRLLDNNPRPVERDDILGMYRDLFGLAGTA